ncbi:MAG: hypothetical protein M1830_006769, partial [Pleopsidium flavum]
IIQATFHPLLTPSQTLPSALVPALLRRFTTSEGYRLYPDVLPFFHFLRLQRESQAHSKPSSISSQWPWHQTIVGVITNSDDRVPSILESLGLTVSALRFGLPTLGSHSAPGDEDVDFVALSYDVGEEKPHHLVFDAAKELLRTRLELEPREVEEEFGLLHVGDDMEKDVLGARNAGWGSVLLDREEVYANNTEVTNGSVKRIVDLIELRDWRP